METTFEVAKAEEQEARRRHRALAKARRVKTRASESALWTEVRRRARENGCRCDLRPGMTYRELVELGSGCKGGDRYRAGWVCPVLGYYRDNVKRR